MEKYRELTDEFLKIIEGECKMYYRVTGQDTCAEWKEKELRVKELGKKIYKIEGEVEFKDVKTVLSKKLGYKEDRIKIIKIKNSPELHKKVESVFLDN